MFSPHTVQTAHNWYQKGVSWVYKQSTHAGITHLDKALAVFDENGDLHMATLARHHKMLAFCIEGKGEEAENLFPQIMQGYVHLDELYGKALLLCHLADSITDELHWPRAVGHYRTAAELAAWGEFKLLHAHVLVRQASLFKERDNLSTAIDLFQQARRLTVSHLHSATYSEALLILSQCFIQMGEPSEAAPLLEELQNLLTKQHRLKEALEPLVLLSRLYDQVGMEQDQLRVSQKLHICGQRALNTQQNAPTDVLGPPIDRSFSPSAPSPIPDTPETPRPRPRRLQQRHLAPGRSAPR